MAKVKKTKVEMKAQKEALKRFQRFLPMLLLKKQQLQVEIQTITAKIDDVYEQESMINADLDAWVSLLAEPVDLESLVIVDEVETSRGNIAGVNIPVLDKVVMKPVEHDLFSTPPWMDNAIQALGQLTKLEIERKIYEEQRELVKNLVIFSTLSLTRVKTLPTERSLILMKLGLVRVFSVA